MPTGVGLSLLAITQWNYLHKHGYPVDVDGRPELLNDVMVMTCDDGYSSSCRLLALIVTLSSFLVGNVLLLPAAENNQQSMGLADEHRLASWSEAEAVWSLCEHVSGQLRRSGVGPVCVSKSGGVLCESAQRRCETDRSKCRHGNLLQVICLRVENTGYGR